MANDISRLRTRKASELIPSANMSTLATVASSKSNALSRLTGTESAQRKSASTNARRLPRRNPHAVTSSRNRDTRLANTSNPITGPNKANAGDFVTLAR